MAWLIKNHNPGAYVRTFAVWGVLGALMGVVGGLIGAGFHHALHFMTGVRAQWPWLVALLPLGGLLIVWLYRKLNLCSNRGTNDVIDAILTNHGVTRRVTPAIFLATVITHLFGGSAGREGAALQIGASTASFISKGMKLSRTERTVLIMSGMSAVFAGLFGTPLTACLFTMEFESVGTIFTPALLPCFLSAFVASQVSGLLGVHAETHMLDAAAAINAGSMVQYVILAVLLSVVGMAMCYFFHHAEKLAHRMLPDLSRRIVVGGAVVLLLTIIAGDQRFNGAGMEMALKAVGGQADWYSFAVKMLFTAVTLSCGFKGGEIVPTFCIGATFGCCVGGMLGLDPGLCGALGLVGLFCCATNSPLASIVLSIEMFGSANLHLFALICVITFVLSGNSGLYGSQIIQFSKTDLSYDKHRKKQAHFG